MTSRPDVLAICPSRSPVARSAASLRRVPWGGFPDLVGTISGLRPLPARPASLRCLRSAVPPVAPFAPRSRGAAPGPGPLLPRRPGRLITVETGRYPKFLGDPCLHALLFDPGGPLASGLSDARDIAFRIYNYVGSASGLSRLNHTAYRLLCWSGCALDLVFDYAGLGCEAIRTPCGLAGGEGRPGGLQTPGSGGGSDRFRLDSRNRK